MRTNKKFIINYISVLVLTLCYFYLVITQDSVQFFEDSPGYISFANEILSGQMFSDLSFKDSRWYLLNRTPGFPFILATGKLITGNIHDGILFMHTLLGIVAFLYFCFSLAKDVPLILVGLITLLGYSFFMLFLPLALSEWSSFCILMILIATTYRSLREESIFPYFFLCLLSSLACLFRPVLALTYFLPLFVLCIRPKNLHKKLFCFCLSLLPIISWMYYSYLLGGKFTLSHIQNHTAFGTAAIIGHANLKENDSTELKLFINHVNSNKFPKPNEEIAFLEDSRDRYFNTAYLFDQNIYDNAIPYANQKGWDMNKTNKMLRDYTLRVFRTNIPNLIYYVYNGLRASVLYCLYSIPIIPFIILSIMYGFYYQYKYLKWEILNITFLGVLGFHVLYSIICSTLQWFKIRYLFLSLCPLIICTLISLLPLVMRTAREIKASLSRPH